MSGSTENGGKGNRNTEGTLKCVCHAIAIKGEIPSTSYIPIGKIKIVKSVVKTLKVDERRVAILHLCSCPEIIDKGVEFEAEGSD